jgi:predicted nucleotidyltransferase
LYSLQKWALLAAKGNPSSLHFLFAPAQFRTIWWERIQEKSEIFLVRGHVRPYLGFADDQLKRLFGEKGQKNIHRAHLEEQFGYDTKYAMHVIRLYGEAKELMETGKITLPRPNAAELIDIRKGKYKLHEIRTWARRLEEDALRASDTSPLATRINREGISRLISDVYRNFWNDRYP